MCIRDRIEVVVASTWNKGLAQAWGECMGKISQEMGAEGWYAPVSYTHLNSTP